VGRYEDSLYLHTYEDGTECSETSAYKIQTPENYPEESIQHSEHGESLKSRIIVLVILFMQGTYNYAHLKQTMFLGYIVLQLFCIYSLCYM